jgi:hypothetical protein
MGLLLLWKREMIPSMKVLFYVQQVLRVPMSTQLLE